MILRIRSLWCALVHASDYWPRSTVECRICGLRRPNPWAKAEPQV